jgi:hypothetical protein
MTRANFSWLALILLLASVFFFWVLPFMGRREVKVEFEEPKTTQAQP